VIWRKAANQSLWFLIRLVASSTSWKLISLALHFGDMMKYDIGLNNTHDVTVDEIAKDSI
jgi:hypothetical protein